MRLIVMSDSHGNVEFVRKVVEIAKQENADLTIHLGDEYIDMKQFLSDNVIVIPGVYELEYADQLVVNRKFVKLGDLRFLMTHTRTSHPNDFDDDIKPEEIVAKRGVDIVLFGHSHLYYAEVENGVLFVNPGHLKVEDKKGMPPTYAMLDIDGRSVSVSIAGIDSKKYLEKKFVL